ncbi:hypothetical protein LCM17_06525 [Cereibacter sphaeroides]|nr:hypothetical protein [Cereibacter sphaeroides]
MLHQYQSREESPEGPIDLVTGDSRMRAVPMQDGRTGGANGQCRAVRRHMRGNKDYTRNMTKRRILILGNSHSRMVLQAGERSGVPGGVELDVKWLGKNGDTSNAEALELIADLPPESLIAITHFGTLHNIIGILNHPVPFSLAESPAGPVPVPEGHAVIPLQQMRAFIERSLHKPTFYDTVQAATTCPIVHYMPPPPKEIPGVRAKESYRGQKISEAGFAPKPSRLALWQLEDALVREYLSKRGIGSLDVPAQALTPEGFLAEEFFAPDMTHANWRYGALILNDLVARLGRLEEELSPENRV